MTWQVFRVNAITWAAVEFINPNVYARYSRHRSEAAAQRVVDRLNEQDQRVKALRASANPPKETGSSRRSALSGRLARTEACTPDPRARLRAASDAGSWPSTDAPDTATAAGSGGVGGGSLLPSVSGAGSERQA